MALQAAPQFLLSPRTLKSTYVHSSTGGVVPLNAFTHAAASTSPLGVNHSSFFPSATVAFNLAPESRWARRRY